MNATGRSRYLRKTIILFSLLDIITCLTHSDISIHSISEKSVVAVSSLLSVTSIFLTYTYSILFKKSRCHHYHHHGPNRSSTLLLFSIFIIQIKLYTIARSLYSNSNSLVESAALEEFCTEYYWICLSKSREIILALVLSCLVLVEMFVDFELEKEEVEEMVVMDSCLLPVAIVIENKDLKVHV